MHKIAITTTSFGKFDKKPLELLRDAGFEIVLNPYGRKLNKNEVVEVCGEAVGIIAGTETLDREVFDRLTGLKVVSRCGTGMDNVDVQAAEIKGVKVFNTPDAPTLAVAELTIGLMLNLLRRISLMDAGIRRDKWDKLMGNLLHKKRVGILGFGRIGMKVAELLSAFGAELAYCDLEPKACKVQCGQSTLPELLGWADIITLHLSTSKGCEPIIGRTELGMMKKGAWLLNASRGGLVDEQALCDSLKSGALSGAALDVFESEPYNGPLKELDNVILTPHIGSYARESRIAMELESAENLLRGLTDRTAK